MNTAKKIFARLLIVSWFGVVALIIANYYRPIDALQIGGVFALFVLAIQYISFGILNPMNLLEKGKND